jgi:hypothetical protein
MFEILKIKGRLIIYVTDIGGMEQWKLKFCSHNERQHSSVIMKFCSHNERQHSSVITNRICNFFIAANMIREKDHGTCVIVSMPTLLVCRLNITINNK